MHTWVITPELNDLLEKVYPSPNRT